MSKNEHDEIGEVIEAYLSAIKTGDDGFFERAFYPDSVVINATEDDRDKSITPIADFINRIKGSHMKGIRVEEIPTGMTVSHVGKASNVRLDFELIIGDKTLYGTDYFNLVKRGGEWRISQKIFYITHQE
jgi:hypothetical protein